MDKRHLPLDFEVNNDQCMHRPFQIEDLEKALRASPNRSPGKDNIAFHLLDAIPSRGKGKLLTLLNGIWSTGDIPKPRKRPL